MDFFAVAIYRGGPDGGDALMAEPKLLVSGLGAGLKGALEAGWGARPIHSARWRLIQFKL